MKCSSKLIALTLVALLSACGPKNEAAAPAAADPVASAPVAPVTEPAPPAAAEAATATTSPRSPWPKRAISTPRPPRRPGSEWSLTSTGSIRLSNPLALEATLATLRFGWWLQ